MGKIMIDFGNVVEEMKNKKVKLCLLHKRVGWFLIDSQNVYCKSKMQKVAAPFCR